MMSYSLESMSFNSATATKSLRVLLGHPVSLNALAMLQRFSEMVRNTFSYRSWMAVKLWVLTRPEDCCCCCGCCCGSLLLRSVCSSAFSSAMVFLACASLVWRVWMASDFVQTRLASSSASLFDSSKSLFSSSCSFCWFWNAKQTRSCSFTKLAYNLLSSLSDEEDCAEEALVDCEEDFGEVALVDCEDDWAVLFFFLGGCSEQEHSRLSPLQTPHLLLQ